MFMIEVCLMVLTIVGPRRAGGPTRLISARPARRDQLRSRMAPAHLPPRWKANTTSLADTDSALLFQYRGRSRPNVDLPPSLLAVPAGEWIAVTCQRGPGSSLQGRGSLPGPSRLGVEIEGGREGVHPLFRVRTQIGDGRVSVSKCRLDAPNEPRHTQGGFPVQLIASGFV